MTVAPPRYAKKARSQQRLLTVEDLVCFPDSLPSGDIKYELHAGKLLIMSPPDANHGKAQNAISAYLFIEGVQRGLGLAYTEVSIILSRDPDTVQVPDSAFILARSLPAKVSTEGYLETIPEIIVEIRSKNDRITEIEKKMNNYFKAGVKEAWLIDAKVNAVIVYRGTGKTKTFAPGDVLKSKLLPGFAVEVQKLLS